MKDVEEARPLAGTPERDEEPEEDAPEDNKSVAETPLEESDSEEGVITEESNSEHDVPQEQDKPEETTTWKGRYPEDALPHEESKPLNESNRTLQCRSFDESEPIDESQSKGKEEFLLIPKKLPKRFIILGTLAFVVMVSAVSTLGVLLSKHGSELGTSSNSKSKAGSSSLDNSTLTPNKNNSESSCPTEAGAFEACLNTKLTYIESKLCMSCTTRAFNAVTQKDACPDKQTQFCDEFLDCTSCETCFDTAQSYFDCLLGDNCDVNCGTGFATPTVSPAPTPASMACSPEKEAYQKCFVTDLSKGDREACVKCTNEVLSNTVYDQDCSAFIDSFCPAFNNCVECARCSDELEGYITCVSDICEFDCKTVAREPVISPSAAPTVQRCVTEEDDYESCLLSDVVTSEDHVACVACVNSGLAKSSFESCDAFHGSFCPVFNSCASCALCYDEILSYIECGTDCRVSCK